MVWATLIWWAWVFVFFPGFVFFRAALAGEIANERQREVRQQADGEQRPATDFFERREPSRSRAPSSAEMTAVLTDTVGVAVYGILSLVLIGAVLPTSIYFIIIIGLGVLYFATSP